MPSLPPWLHYMLACLEYWHKKLKFWICETMTILVLRIPLTKLHKYDSIVIWKPKFNSSSAKRLVVHTVQTYERYIFVVLKFQTQQCKHGRTGREGGEGTAAPPDCWANKAGRAILASQVNGRHISGYADHINKHRLSMYTIVCDVFRQTYNA